LLLSTFYNKNSFQLQNKHYFQLRNNEFSFGQAFRRSWRRLPRSRRSSDAGGGSVRHTAASERPGDALSDWVIHLRAQRA